MNLFFSQKNKNHPQILVIFFFILIINPLLLVNIDFYYLNFCLSMIYTFYLNFFVF